MLSEQDEFLLSRLIDGDLSPEEITALQARLAREPALRETLDQLQRLNGALLTQRAAQPRVNLALLHADIMREVESSQSPAIIRFPLWTRAAGLIAAAAAIVLMFTVFRPAGAPRIESPTQLAQAPPSPTNIPSAVPPGAANPGKGPAPTAITLAANPDIPSDNVHVKFNRPSPARSSGIKISYVRSDVLANAMKARDTERQNRPTVSVMVAQRPKPRIAGMGSPFDAPL